MKSVKFNMNTLNCVLLVVVLALVVVCCMKRDTEPFKIITCNTKKAPNEFTRHKSNKYWKRNCVGKKAIADCKNRCKTQQASEDHVPVIGIGHAGQQKNACTKSMPNVRKRIFCNILMKHNAERWCGKNNRNICCSDSKNNNCCTKKCKKWRNNNPSCDTLESNWRNAHRNDKHKHWDTLKESCEERVEEIEAEWRDDQAGSFVFDKSDGPFYDSDGNMIVSVNN